MKSCFRLSIYSISFYATRISSRYTNTKVMQFLIFRKNKHSSFFAISKLISCNLSLDIAYHSLSACFRPYIAFFNLHAFPLPSNWSNIRCARTHCYVTTIIGDDTRLHLDQHVGYLHEHSFFYQSV